jgi:excisionase family DNA binding protein
MSANLKLMPLAKLLYSVSEAAELLSCSKSTVYGLIRSGELVSVHATSRTRISAAALVRYVQLKEADAYVERRAQRRATR